MNTIPNGASLRYKTSFAYRSLCLTCANYARAGYPLAAMVSAVAQREGEHPAELLADVQALLAAQNQAVA